MFDLPVENARQRRSYAKFRKRLLEWGYEAFQKSAYVKYCDSDEYGETIRNMVCENAPNDGAVNTFVFPDHVFAKQDFIRDGERASPPAKPAMVEFF